MKKRLSLLLVAILLAIPMVMATDSTGSVEITTFVEENVSNTGIRVTTDTEDITPTFDAKFFAATDSITIANTALDNSTNTITGSFSVLVRRASGASVDVAITAGLLENGSNTLDYTLVGTDVDLAINSVAITGESYTIPAVTTGIIQHQNIITYTIPADIDARAGTYTADIIFTITT